MSGRTHGKKYWAIIFLLSQDYLFIEWPSNRGLFGFPVWIGWFMFVHITFIGLFFLFSKKHWK